VSHNDSTSYLQLPVSQLDSNFDGDASLIGEWIRAVEPSMAILPTLAVSLLDHLPAVLGARRDRRPDVLARPAPLLLRHRHNPRPPAMVFTAGVRPTPFSMR
jgi:hypothetical protein